MTPVFQERRGKEGDCLRACVASLLDLPLHDVPDLLADHDDQSPWVEHVNRHLASLGVALAIAPGSAAPLGEALRFGQDDGSETAHVQVVRDGVLVHDPKPLPMRDLDQVFAYLVLLELA